MIMPQMEAAQRGEYPFIDPAGEPLFTVDDMMNNMATVASLERQRIAEMVEKECNSWYDLYLRKATCPSEFSRNMAPGQMDAIHSIQEALMQKLKELK